MNTKYLTRKGKGELGRRNHISESVYTFKQDIERKEEKNK